MEIMLNDWTIVAGREERRRVQQRIYCENGEAVQKDKNTMIRYMQNDNGMQWNDRKSNKIRVCLTIWDFSLSGDPYCIIDVDLT